MTTTEDPPPRMGAVGRARASVDALETLAAIRREGRAVATDAEREVLAGWSGWGPLAPAFAPQDNTWGDLSERMRRALPAEDVELGSRGTYMSFYTPEPVASAMWEILRGLGFDGGRVIEPGCGAGVFMRTAPDSAVVTGVDRDTTSADICRLLNPGRTVITDEFQTARLVGQYAAAIGNVPFGDVRVYHPSAPRAVTGSLHDFFIWRTVDLLAPGGVAVLLTSRYTMDKRSSGAREAIGQLADLIAAFRLPNGALGGGTGIIADVLVLRRRVDQHAGGRAWYNTTTNEELGYSNPINTYWGQYPEAVLGEMGPGTTNQYGLAIEVKPRPTDLHPATMLVEAADKPIAEAGEKNLRWVAPVDVGAAPDTAGLVTAEGWYNGSLQLVDDGVARVEDGRLVPVERPSQQLRHLLRLRDLAVTLVKYEADHTMGDRLIDPARAAAAKCYADYVGKYGALNKATVVAGKPDEETGMPTYSRRVSRVMSTFLRDPDAALVCALEVYDDETQQATPAPILSTRQNLPSPQPTSTDDPQQALAWSLNRRSGTVDLEFIAGLLRVDVDAVAGLLGDSVYEDPKTLRWVTAEEYLSGDVRAKLAVAETAAAALDRFERNVTALTAVLPAWLGPGEIGVNLGAPWIPSSDVQQFIAELLGNGHVSVQRVPQTSQWEVEVSSWARDTPAATADWGTFDVDAYRLIELALNGRTPVVHRTVVIDGAERQRKDPDASLAAAEKQARIKERFAEWLWEDGDRADRLVEFYNQRFNCLVARTFSGEHVTVDGLAPWFAAKVYPHQKEWVARAVSTRAALCGLPVGAGKTAMMAMTAMKLRQSGLVNKPMVVVPNHLLLQIDGEFRRLFPAARILSASAATIAEGRRAFNARVATQDWDMVLVTHSAFDRMAVSPQTEAAYLQEQLADIEEALLFAAPDGRMQGRMVKALAKRKDALVEQIKELTDRARGYDLGVAFESLGVDYLLVDEAHYYKAAPVAIRTEGFSVRTSKRATALEIKLRWLKERGAGPYASLYTGTAVSNTMLELYVMLRYLMQDELRALDLGTADGWAATFVQFVTSVDVTIDGGQFRLVTKPSLFVNAPELRLMLSQVADIRTPEQLGLPRPEYTVETVVIEPTAAQRDYSADLVARAEAVQRRSPFDKGDSDNMLAICGDGRRMATDPALVGLHDDEPGKLAAVAANMLRIWRADPNCLQIGFCDVGTPNPDKGTQTYGRLRRLLTEGGMPVGKIRFIHDAKNDGAKGQMFAECRAEGKVSVILGSTDMLGVGTNIQRRVAAIHHIDAPWRPADVEQRDGRGVRPGNRYKLVRIYRYVVERTFDAYSWQLLTRKAGFISQVLSGNVGREVEDITADVVQSYAAVKAAATGQPLLLEKAKVDTEVKRLRGIQSGHTSTVRRLRRDIGQRTADIRTMTRQAEAWEALAAATGGEVADLDEDAAKAFHDTVADFKRSWRYSQGIPLAGVQVTLDSWTVLDGKTHHPLLRIRGNDDADWVEKRAYRYWTPQQLAKEFVAVLRDAPYRAASLREQIARMQQQNIDAAASADRPFAEADQLTAALARLDQINAALHAAALRSGEDEDTAVATAVPAGRRPLDDLEPVAPQRVDEPAPATPPAPAPVTEPAPEPEPERTPVVEPEPAPEPVPAAAAQVLAAGVASGRVIIAHIGAPAPAPAEPEPVVDVDDVFADLMAGTVADERADQVDVDDVFADLMAGVDDLTDRVFADLMAG